MPVGTPYNTGPNRWVKYAATQATTVTVGDLGGGLDYHCLVRARYGPDWSSWKGDGNEGPLSDWSNTVHIPVTAPLSPTKVTASTPPLPTGQSTSVGFTVATNNSGTAITQFEATCASSNGGATRTKVGTSSPLTVSSLSVGKRYTCTVTATNKKGTSGPSSASAAIVVPAGPPTNVVAGAPAQASGKWRTAVTFTAPDGGPAVSSYRIACAPVGGGTTFTSTGNALDRKVVVNLAASTSYRCTVTAVYGSTAGPVSSPSNQIKVP